MPFRRAREIVDAAKWARSVCGLLMEPFDVDAILRSLYVGADTAGYNFRSGVEEMVWRTDDGVRVAYQRGADPARVRFVVAHALGHLMLGDPISAAARPGFVGEPWREARADAFAAELLVPLERVRRLVDLDLSCDGDLYHDQIDFLARRFNVTRDLIRERVSQLADDRPARTIILAESA